jgi:hypothetical protein
MFRPDRTRGPDLLDHKPGCGVAPSHVPPSYAVSSQLLHIHDFQERRMEYLTSDPEIRWLTQVA